MKLTKKKVEDEKVEIKKKEIQVDKKEEERE